MLLTEAASELIAPFSLLEAFTPTSPSHYELALLILQMESLIEQKKNIKDKMIEVGIFQILFFGIEYGLEN